MPTSNPFAFVPAVQFVSSDANQIEQAIVTAYQAAWLAGQGTVKILAPGDPVKLFLQVIAALIAQQRALINAAGQQNLLAYSVAPFLDNLGALYGARGMRLAASSAATTLQFNLSGPLGIPVIVPQGTQVSTADGTLGFVTALSLTIAPGATNGTVLATCLTPGLTGNGYLPGQIDQLVNFSSPFVVSAANTTTSEGGADIETDDAYRLRLYLAADSFSSAGPSNAYAFWAYTADTSIADVAVYGPPISPAGEAHVVILLQGGSMPTSSVLTEVYNALTASDIRPLTDHVFVEAPVTTGYVLNVQYWIDQANSPVALSIENNVAASAAAWVTYTGTKIGRSINPSKLIQDMMEAGASRVNVVSPPYAGLPVYGLAVCTGYTIVYEGLEGDLS